MKDDNLFWKTVMPFFSNKGDHGPNVKVIELPQYNQKIANELITF